MQYSGGQKHFKALLGQYLFPEWKLNVALSMNVVDLILYYFFFRNGNPMEKRFILELEEFVLKWYIF